MSWTTERARVAALSRSRKPDDPDLVNASRNLKAARLTDYIQKQLAAAPPLTDEQRSQLATLIAPTGGVR